jgi:Na+/melibiose symporter-like transporter
VLQPDIESSEHSLPADTAVSAQKLKSSNSAARTGILVYFIAIALGLFSGWVNQVADDALLTSLCVLAFSMLMGVWKKDRPWRWVMLVWIGVPIVLAYYQFVVRWPHDRSQVYGAFLQILAASAGGFGGHFMREMIEHVFLKNEE